MQIGFNIEKINLRLQWVFCVPQTTVKEFITRSWEDEKRTRKESNNERSKIVFEQKESFRWFSSIKKALPQCSAVPFKTVVADREADIYPLLSGLKEELEVDYVIRSRFNRPTKGGETILNEVGDWSVEDCYDLQVPATFTVVCGTQNTQGRLS